MPHEKMTVRCTSPRKLPTGELECPRCGLIWDLMDERPVCWAQQSAPEPQPDRPRSGDAYRAARGK